MVNVLAVENVTKFAQDVISLMPLECEWGGMCEAELNSWSALKEHLQLHLQQLGEEADGGYRCRLPRCTCYYHATLHDLRQHIESGHLSRLPLPCPAAGCTMTVTHHGSLSVHFSAVHGGLLNNPAIHKIGILKKMRTPQHLPSSMLSKRPSDLPSEPIPLYTTMTPPIARSRRQEGPSQAPTASQTRRKWNKMRGEGYIDEEDNDDSTPFKRLPVVNFDAITEFTDCIIRLRHPEPVPQLSRPPHVAIPPIPEKVPPVSMGFGAFEEKFKELEKAGLIDGAGEWPDENDDASPTPS